VCEREEEEQRERGRERERALHSLFTFLFGAALLISAGSVGCDGVVKEVEIFVGRSFF
jgi:hypothetical protein